jgi:hypothetical protein
MTTTKHAADREVFDAMRAACTALDVQIEDLERLDAAQFAELFDRFADWFKLLRRVASVVAVALLLATGAAAQTEMRPRPPQREPLPLDPPTTWTCQQWRVIDSQTLGGVRGWFHIGSVPLVEYAYQLTELQRLGGRFINDAIAPDVRSGLGLLVDGALSHDVEQWTTGERRMWRACTDYERHAVRRDEVDRIMRRGAYACVGCLYWNSGGAK